MIKQLRIGALISGGGTNLQAVIDACESDRISGKVVFVGTDNANAGGLNRAHKHGIETFIVDYGQIIRQYRQTPDKLPLPNDFNLDELSTKQRLFEPETAFEKINAFFATRAAAESQLLEKIEPFKPDLLVLAGFMRNLSPYFIDRFNTNSDQPRIMNIHPALLPAFPGVDGYGDTYRYGCKLGGCTVHFIDYGEDSGPIIGQKSFPISDKDTLDDVKKRGLSLEWELYPECIQHFAENRLQVVTVTHTLDSGAVTQRRIVKIAQSVT